MPFFYALYEYFPRVEVLHFEPSWALGTVPCLPGGSYLILRVRKVILLPVAGRAIIVTSTLGHFLNQSTNKSKNTNQIRAKFCHTKKLN